MCEAPAMTRAILALATLIIIALATAALVDCGRSFDIAGIWLGGCE